MRFATRYFPYTHEIAPAVTEPRRGEGGVWRDDIVVPRMAAEFSLSMVMTYDEREAAAAHFDALTLQSNGDPAGPYRTATVISLATDESVNGEIVEGSNQAFQYGGFDTADESMCPPEWRDRFEAVLSGDAEACRVLNEKHGIRLRPTTDLGHTMLRLDTLVSRAPWPTYDTITGAKAAVVKQVLAVIDATGIPRERVIAYERGKENRDWLIEAVEAHETPAADPFEVVVN